VLVLEGALDEGSAVLQWLDDDDNIVAAATVNHRMALPKLKRLANGVPDGSSEGEGDLPQPGVVKAHL
jgi:hypothetical protein